MRAKYTKAFDRGVSAANQGATKNDNPYGSDSPRAAAQWNRGWAHYQAKHGHAHALTPAPSFDDEWDDEE